MYLKYSMILVDVLSFLSYHSLDLFVYNVLLENIDIVGFITNIHFKWIQDTISSAVSWHKSLAGATELRKRIDETWT